MAQPLNRRGQALVFVALVLPLVLLPVAAYAVEASRLAALQARLQEVTSLAALDAAQQIDVAALRSGAGLRLEPVAAEATARTAVAAADPAASVSRISVTGAQVSLSTARTVPLVFGTILPVSSVTLRASASARLRAGFEGPAR